MNNEFIGKLLLDRGFENWFRYLFRVIEGKPFIMEAIHTGLFEYFDKLYKGEVTRLNINVPPRAGKTTLAKYFLIFALTINPRSNIIYTSFSQSLLQDIAQSVRNILEHPIYKAMYPGYRTYENETINPINDFWLEYLKKETGHTTYSAKKITTAQGGVCLFASIGSQITGYGAGIRNGKGSVTNKTEAKMHKLNTLTNQPQEDIEPEDTVEHFKPENPEDVVHNDDGSTTYLFNGKFQRRVKVENFEDDAMILF